MKRSRIGRRREHHRGIIERAVCFERFYKPFNRACLLPDGAVYTYNVFAFLIEHGVHGYARLSGLTIADNKFSLTFAYREHCVDC